MKQIMYVEVMDAKPKRKKFNSSAGRRLAVGLINSWMLNTLHSTMAITAGTMYAQ